MRFNSVGFALSVGMLLIVVLIGFTLLSAGGLVGFSADDALTTAGAPQDSLGMVNCQGSGPAPKTIFLADLSPAEARIIATGDALFKGNCAQCHAVNEQVVGPALAGIAKRRPTSWLLPWVKNASKVVASGDDYAMAIYNKYNKQQMPSFALSDKEITAILTYVSFEEGGSAYKGQVAVD
jgi:mono/diheme cytochrome c family protein